MLTFDIASSNNDFDDYLIGQRFWDCDFSDLSPNFRAGMDDDFLHASGNYIDKKFFRVAFRRSIYKVIQDRSLELS